MTNFPPALPHGSFDELLPDVFFLTGMIRVESDPVSEFSRNMVVIRDGADLTLVNTIRLNAAGLSALEQLGTVKQVVRLGGFHGRDDAFYLDRYGADLWAVEGMSFSRGECTNRLLIDGHRGPNPDSLVIAFDTPKVPEAVLHLERHDSILITCDSFQNMLGPDGYFNEYAAETKRQLGFFNKAVIGPGWKKFAEPKEEDFDRISALEFRHLLTGHGEPLLDDAYQAVTSPIDDFKV